MKNWNLSRWLLFLICFGAIPHVVRIPIWNTALCSGFLLWFHFHLQGRVQKPNKKLRTVFAFATLGGILFTYRTVLGLDAGLAFIVQISCLKLFEVEEMRDSILIVWLSSLLMIGEILYEQNLLVTLWFLIGIGFIAHVMGKIYQWEFALKQNREDKNSWRFNWRSAAQVIPLAVILFFAFPRVNFSLWGAFNAGMSGVVGFSDELRPGEVAQLASDNRVAFRVRILEGELPAVQDLYWRGLVLSSTDGVNWIKTRGVEAPQAKRIPAATDMEKRSLVTQEITLEAHQRRWLFAMDVPEWMEMRGGFETGFQRYEGGYYTSKRLVQGRVSYLVRSKVKPSEKRPFLSPTERKRETQLPPKYESRLKDLAEEIRLVASDDADYVQRVLAYFRDNDFEYTLSPGKLTRRDLGEFVFETKKGFCEHFAAATAILLRLGGVPARVVAGFQGGRKNPYGDYLIVSYRDAHSWVEAWIDGKGWQRIDPTGVVAPGRLNLGGQEFVDRFGVDPDIQRALAANLDDQEWNLKRVILELVFLWDLMNDSWNNALISYDRDFQREMVSKLSWNYPIWMQLGALFVGGLLLIGLLLFLYYRLKRSPVDELTEVYEKLLRSLSKRGIRRNFAEGPLTLKERVRREAKAGINLPEIESAIDEYIHLRFGDADVDKEKIREFRRKVRIVA